MPLLRDNFANPAGCAWQGIAGQVTDGQGQPVLRLVVRVTGDGIKELMTTTGTNTLYGPSGWEVQLSRQPGSGRFRVELLSSDGVPLAAVVDISFPGTCEQNLALVNYVQAGVLQPLQPLQQVQPIQPVAPLIVLPTATPQPIQ
jgi:hypothetical protein